MPKLSEHTLGKMFPCDYCGDLFRTRQGLSGHIHFKHQLLQKDGDTYIDKVRRWQKKLWLWQLAVKEKNLPKNIGNLGEDILHRWLVLIGYFDQLNIRLSDNEFKNFFIQNFNFNNSQSEQDMLITLKALEILNPKS